MDSPFILAVAWLLVAWCVAALGYVLSEAIRTWLRRRDTWDRALRRLVREEKRRDARGPVAFIPRQRGPSSPSSTARPVRCEPDRWQRWQDMRAAARRRAARRDGI